MGEAGEAANVNAVRGQGVSETPDAVSLKVRIRRLALREGAAIGERDWSTARRAVLERVTLQKHRNHLAARKLVERSRVARPADPIALLITRPTRVPRKHKFERGPSSSRAAGGQTDAGSTTRIRN